MKAIVFLFLAFGLTACGTLQERLGKRSGCDPTKVVVKDQVHAPGYTEYKFTCDGKAMVCRDAPFYSSCDEDKGKKKVEEKADEKPAAKK